MTFGAAAADDAMYLDDMATETTCRSNVADWRGLSRRRCWTSESSVRPVNGNTGLKTRFGEIVEPAASILAARGGEESLGN